MTDNEDDIWDLAAELDTEPIAGLGEQPQEQQEEEPAGDQR